MVHLVGIDEVGRGPLAGPVAVCAVAIKRKLSRGFWKGLKNSKALSEKAREMWFARAREARAKGLIDYTVCFSGALSIDNRGISKVVHECIARALRRLNIEPEKSRIFLDGSIYAPARFKNQKTIVRGDEKVPVIALASVVAKVRRDRRMRRYAKSFPHYGFEEHVGYGTAAHYKAINTYGLTELHRRSFLSAFCGDGKGVGEQVRSPRRKAARGLPRGR